MKTNKRSEQQMRKNKTTIITITLVLITILCMMSLAACHAEEEETAEESTVTETTEEPESVEEDEAPPLSEMEMELLGVWGEPKGEGHIIRLKEDRTLSVYEYDGEFSDEDAELIHTRDGAWYAEGDEVCISIDDSSIFYTFDGDNHDFLVDSNMENFYTRLEDDGTIPE